MRYHVGTCGASWRRWVTSGVTAVAMLAGSVHAQQPATQPTGQPNGQPASPGAPMKIEVKPRPKDGQPATPANPVVTPAQDTEPVVVPLPPMEIKVRPAGGPVVVDSAETLLEALEFADAGIRTLVADLVYDKTFDIGGDRQVRRGMLYYSDDKGEGGMPRQRKFAVNFTSLKIGQRLENEPKIYIFDGVWLVEKLPTQKQFVKRQVVGEGEQFDPLKIGEGPMPIPIGQRKSETLARFEATLLPETEGLEGEDDAQTNALHAHVKGAYQLLLVPKADTPESRDFREIRLWYRRSPADGKGPILPVLARTVSRAEDVSLVRLSNVRLNEKLDPSVLDTKPPGKDWKIDVRTRESE